MGRRGRALLLRCLTSPASIVVTGEGQQEQDPVDSAARVSVDRKIKRRRQGENSTATPEMRELLHSSLLGLAHMRVLTIAGCREPNLFLPSAVYLFTR
jgi:hypothetical protein